MRKDSANVEESSGKPPQWKPDNRGGSSVRECQATTAGPET
jgi:hypothetical protein